MSSSSISSESSAWDTRWYSILYRPEPQLKKYLFYAKIAVDLRHSDAEMVRQLGPMRVDFGGTFGQTAVARDVRDVIDDLTVEKTFNRIEDARMWQDVCETRIRHRLMEIRTVFLTQYPLDFFARHRRI